MITLENIVYPAAIMAIAHFWLASGGVKALGIESIRLPFLQDPTAATEAAKAKLDRAAAEFEKSDFLKGLKERSEQNREKYVSS